MLGVNDIQEVMGLLPMIYQLLSNVQCCLNISLHPLQITSAGAGEATPAIPWTGAGAGASRTGGLVTTGILGWDNCYHLDQSFRRYRWDGRDGLGSLLHSTAVHVPRGEV